MGIAGNRSIVHMPLPLFDINQAMKGAWEAGSSNDKLLQTIRDIELCVYRNVSAHFNPASPLALPPSYPPPFPPMNQDYPEPDHHNNNDYDGVTDTEATMTEGSSPETNSKLDIADDVCHILWL